MFSRQTWNHKAEDLFFDVGYATPHILRHEMLDLLNSWKQIQLEQVLLRSETNIIKLLALTRKICGILSKRLQKLVLLNDYPYYLSKLKTTVFCSFFQLFDIPQTL